MVCQKVKRVAVVSFQKANATTAQRSTCWIPASLEYFVSQTVLKKYGRTANRTATVPVTVTLMRSESIYRKGNESIASIRPLFGACATDIYSFNFRPAKWENERSHICISLRVLGKPVRTQAKVLLLLLWSCYRLADIYRRPCFALFSGSDATQMIIILRSNGLETISIEIPLQAHFIQLIKNAPTAQQSEIMT